MGVDEDYFIVDDQSAEYLRMKHEDDQRRTTAQ